MIRIEENVSLRPYNTFGIDVRARLFCRIATEDDLKALIKSSTYQENRRLILGGGSNILFTQDFNGLVIKSELRGIAITNQTDETISITVKAGEVWHDLVMHCVEQGWGGIENLSLIPGTVGAAPIQNIGAYGIELKEVVDTVHGIDLTNGEERSFTNRDCAFGYRDSVFKHQLKEKIFISSVTLSLTKKNHRLSTHYGALESTLNEMKITQPTLSAIRDAVIQIRTRKLPDPTVIGNAGSFFKNPLISLTQFENLKKLFPEIPGYQTVNQHVKIPAGWLIEQCGWKGKRINQIGVHDKQGLVIVNFGNGNGREIFDLAQQIISSVQEKFNITLSPEVNIID
jgi:UDP-N-acetylmuramate dehydrogenase